MRSLKVCSPPEKCSKRTMSARQSEDGAPCYLVCKAVGPIVEVNKKVF